MLLVQCVLCAASKPAEKRNFDADSFIDSVVQGGSSATNLQKFE